MCTAISINAGDNYFGRNLDYEYDFGQKVAITPRRYCFKFTNGECVNKHFAIIGMALVRNEYPLYFDATNEMGLSAAGLNFPDNAKYMKKSGTKVNVASYEFIPFILSKCKTVTEAKKLIDEINITDEAFDEKFAPSPLHWIVADKVGAITIEQTRSGLKAYDNPVGILTNNPPFDYQMQNLANYLSVTAKEPANLFSDKIELRPYSRGMGGLGLPGDLSSASRFVRACFTKLNCVFGKSENEIVNDFFHILYSVYQQKGCAWVGGDFEITNYSSCCNTDKGIYYYTTYENCDIIGVDMHREDLDGTCVTEYNLIRTGDIVVQNATR